MTMQKSPRKVTTRKGGRPPSDNPKNQRRGPVNLTAAESRMFSRWMRERGLTMDNEALREIVLGRLAADGITDPGPGSIEGQAPTSRFRPTVDPRATAGRQTQPQLALSA